MGLVAGIIGLIFHLNDMHLNDIPASFNQGAADLLGAAMCIGMAQGIIIILGGTDASSGTVLNTILHSISGAMQDLPPVVSAWFMYVFQSVCIYKLYRTYFRLSVRRTGCSKTGVGELGKVPDQVPGSPGCICFPGSGPWRCHRTVIMLQFNCDVIIAITKA